MKYIFLDIDGVLNNGTGPFLHEDKVKLLSEIIEETNAKIILVSSWKDGWYNDKSLCTARAKIIGSVFEKFGIFIYELATKIFRNKRRADCIITTLAAIVTIAVGSMLIILLVAN